MTPSPGRIIHYVLPAGAPRAGEIRPAMIIRVWGPEMVNAKIFLDGPNNDAGVADHGYSISYSEEKLPGTWHWPPRV